jgi:hypothetical protein
MIKNINKIIILLAIILFIAILVFAWNEPISQMPSSVLTPINTSSNKQIKNGEIGATNFVDTDNPNFFVNPNGYSYIKDLEINNIFKMPTYMSTNTLPTCNDQNQGYMIFLQDNLKIMACINNAWTALGGEGGNIVVRESETTCPNGYHILIRHWTSKRCAGDRCYSWAQSCNSLPCECSTSAAWGSVAPTCTYSHHNPDCARCSCVPVNYCQSSTYDGVICERD